MMLNKLIFIKLWFLVLMVMVMAFNKNGVLFSAGLVAVFRETASVFNTGDAAPDKAGFA
jgi:hypothetical protein